MYSLKGIKKGLRQPRVLVQEINRLYHRRLRTDPHNTAGIDVFDADWDNLLILDACWYDLFERVSDLPGDLRPVRSRASSTREFLRANFDGRELLDTVYVTSSPMLYRHRDEVDTRLHDVVNVWRDRGWNEKYRTVLPETMTEAAIDAAERYPDKQILVHYMQPHYPFIGPTGREHFDLDSLNFDWKAIRRGDIDVSDDVVASAYRENLEEAMPEVESALRSLPGLSVVTADHGEMIGSPSFPIPMKEYGHPPGIYTDGLVEVPWLTFRNGPRRSIVAEEPVRERDSAPEEEQSLAQNRLRQLGYLE
jgi:hypothetical protein